MNFQFLVVVAGLLLNFSVAFHENRKTATIVDGPHDAAAADDGGDDFHTRDHDDDADDDHDDGHTISIPLQVSYHRKIMVNYDTLIHYGAVVYSKPGVVNYSTIMTDTVKRTDYKAGIYVGARDWLIKFDQFFNETDAVEIPPSSDDTKNCEARFPADDCHNFIKYIYIEDDFATEKTYVCGTFAYSPACSVRLSRTLSTEIHKINGSFAPGNPRTGMAAYLSGEQLFAGLVDSKNGTTEIQHTKLAEKARIIRTMENKGWLNEAEFVGAFSPSKNDKFVYFVFREIAIEAPIDNLILSRVARICKDDEGGVTGHELEFGSFLKSYLDCGEYNKVQAISYTENDTYFWATFTSDRKHGSAICGFLISDMEAAFRGPYWHQDNETHEWEQCPPPYIQKGEEIAETCFGYRTVDAVVNYTMMSNMIPHNCSRPSFIADAILNKIAVSSGKQDNFTAFAGDDLGRVWTMNLMDCDWAEVVELWEVIPANETSKEINGLTIHNGSLIVLTHHTALQIVVEQYPGDIIIVEPTTSATPTASSPWLTPAPRIPTTSAPSKLTTNSPNYSNSQFSHAALLLTTAPMCF